MDWRIVIGALALSGCTNSFSKVIEVASEVPDWYESRRDEIRGEGYPRLTDVPESAPGGQLQGRVSELSAASQAVYDEFISHPRAQVATRTPDDIRALAAQIQRTIPADLVVPDEPFLTDAEIAAIKRMFEPYEP